LEEEGTKSLEMRRTGTKPKDLSKKEKKEVLEPKPKVLSKFEKKC
jgi:transposase